MLERQPVRRGRVEGSQLAAGERRSKVRVRPGGAARGARAVLQGDGVRSQVVRAGAGALVGISNGALALQAPFASGNRAINAARARRGGSDDAGVVDVEAVRNLHEQHDVLLPCAVVGVSHVFGAGDHAGALRDVAAGIDVRAIERAVAALGRRVDQRSVVGVDRQAAQLGCRGRRGVGDGRRGGRSQAACAQASGQQVVGYAVVPVDGHLAGKGRLGIARHVVAIIAAAAGA